MVVTQLEVNLMLYLRITTQDGYVPITKDAKDPHQNIFTLIELYLRFTQIKCLIIVYALFLELIKFKHVVTQILTLGWMENVIKICIMQKFMKLCFQKNLLLMLILLKLDAIMFNLFKFHQQANLIKIELVDGLHLKLINNVIEKII